MKRLMILMIVLLMPGRIFGPVWDNIAIPAAVGVNPFEDLFNATCFVETRFNTDTVNRIEDAWGIVQIRQGKLSDFNRETGKNYTLQDCLDPVISREIYMHFASKYQPHEIERIARKWNGSGPMTTEYWRKIREAINNPLCRCATSLPTLWSGRKSAGAL